MRPSQPAPPRIHLCLLMAACLAAPFSHADDGAAIARIEAGLRPQVALADAPVKTESLQDAMVRLKVPGVSVAVIHDGKVAWTRSYGVAWTGGPAVTPETLFQAASISKPVSAMAALRMVEQGKLDLDAPIETALAGWKLPAGAGKPSLRQLLSHTGGMSVSGFPGYAAGKPVPSLVQVLDGTGPANTRAVRVDAAPGSAWRYSGGGYTVFQQAMIDRAGKPFDVLMGELVLGPLGMTDSSYAQPLPAALSAKAARPHDRDGKPFPGGAYTYPEQSAAGLWSTPLDLAKFAIAIQQAAAGRDNGVLSPAMTRTMLAPVMNDYALGLQIQDKGKAFGHSGSNMGFKSSLVAFVEGGNGAVILTNGDNGGELAAGLMRAIAHEYKWAGNQTVLRPAVALTPEARKALVGQYAIAGLGKFHVAERDGQLMIALRPGQWEPLYAESDKLLFVLSRNLEVRPIDADNGHTVVGSSSRAYTRVTGLW
ncbi:serine hydrolase domain-containing protein [Massilia consociata]|uniref:Serine hydrolase domain-containing protein n=1 Tax=Massilia consociata TaxID=760117 RepID=A0ABV6FAC6_9BURK